LYCANFEHISFINQDWCHYAADKLNLQIELIKKYSHAGRLNPLKFILDSLKNIIYLTTPFVFQRLRKIKHAYFYKNGSAFACPYSYPPPWRWTDDHLLAIFKKKGNYCKSAKFFLMR